jgi:hypothetical protein
MGSEDVVAVATPPVTVAVPKGVAPLLKDTVPVTPDGRVAVKVTDWPTMDGLAEEVRVTAGDTLFTVCVVIPVAGLLFESPPKEEVIVSLPTGRTVVVMTTVPVTGLTEPEPRVTPPLVTMTVPVVPMGRVVVMVTGSPKLLVPDVVTVTTGVVLLTVWVRLAVAVLLFPSPL